MGDRPSESIVLLIHLAFVLSASNINRVSGEAHYKHLRITYQTHFSKEA